MKPMSVISFLAALLILGISLFWFPTMWNDIQAVMPAGSPTWLIDGLTFFPYLIESLILIVLVIRLTKRGTPRPFE
jgi:hypothetical protein